MAAANTTALELLGKTVSFEYVRFVQLTEHSTATFSHRVSGIVTAVVIHISSEPEILIDDCDFYSLSDLVDFIVSQSVLYCIVLQCSTVQYSTDGFAVLQVR